MVLKWHHKTSKGSSLHENKFHQSIWLNQIATTNEHTSIQLLWLESLQHMMLQLFWERGKRIRLVQLPRCLRL